MSQNTDNRLLESEDLFSSEDLTKASTDSAGIVSEAKDDEPSDEPMTIDENEIIPNKVSEIEDDEAIEENHDPELLEEATAEVIKQTPKASFKTVSVNRISDLPLAKVKSIIKLDPEVNLVNSEAVFLITKATELFVKTLATESFSHANQQKKKTLAKSHVDQALTMLPIEL
ncbi:CLUMA_CG003756, isoform A [Clunio marinus]|uniref:CLUMA_CG003756, isoform A n=1 Tax=Clunio marinus TaxID=568069 RepID=A0A1J1HPQ1_9DIPT|nr:CLUMA_CG003756, isoform A [Clunio marinus]